MKIVKMNSSHVPQIARLEEICFSEPWSEKSIASELENPLSLWLVALDGETVAGYIGSQTVMDETDMMNVAVHPEYRRQGIGEALVMALIRQLQQTGSRILSLEVRTSNVSARNLYEKLGFIQVGKRPRYYRNPREDAYILRKEWEI